MYLENVVFDALDAQRLGRFWEAVVGGETLTDEPGEFETRLVIPDGPTLDLCFQQVPEPPSPEPRIHLDLYGGRRRTEEVERLIMLGAQPLDIGQGDVPWVVLADPEGNPCCVMGESAAYEETGPIAGIPLDSSDPDRDTAFWAWLTRWASSAQSPHSLRHPSQLGPILEMCDELSPKVEVKNRVHLDIRLESGEDPNVIAASIVERGGREVTTHTSALPWRTYTDPSGNEFCVLPFSQ